MCTFLFGKRLVVSASFLFVSATTNAAVTSSFAAGELSIDSDAGDGIAIACVAGNIAVNGGNPDSGSALCADLVTASITGGPDANAIDLSAMLAGDFPAFEGSTITAAGGADAIVGSFTDDVIIWNPGDSSDTNDGGAGDDRIVVNGSGGDNTFLVGPSAVPGFDVRFDGGFTIDIVAAETLEINGNDGADIIDGSMLSAGFLGLEITGGPGADTVTGSSDDDVIIWNPGDGSDTNDGGAGDDRIVVNGSGGDNTFLVGPSAVPGFDVRFDGGFTIDIVAAETLEINGNDGDDTIDGSALVAGFLVLEANGGNGNDMITGTEANDVLNGEDGEDTLIGFRGADTIVGGNDSDTMIWNPGDGSDTNDGGAGDDRVVVNGSGGNNTFLVGPSSATGFDVLFDGGFTIDIVAAETLEVNGNDGDDTIDGSALVAGFLVLEANGGNGNDVITGTEGNDVLNGDDDEDTLTGFRGADTIVGGNDSDTMIWNPGDGSDTNDGGAGDDRVVVNGSGGNNTFLVGPNATLGFDVLFDGGFTIDIVDAETLEVNGNDGDDTIDGSALAAGFLGLEVTGGPGADTVIGSADDDVIIWNPGDGSDTNDGGAGNDRVIVNGSGGNNTFLMGASSVPGFDVRFDGGFTIDIVAAETLEVNGNDGDDLIDARALAGGLIGLELNGGPGSDDIFGSAGNDLIHGDDGDDSLVGFLGNDDVFGDLGEDTMIWNPGDASDLNDGGDGVDVAVVNAAGADEVFDIEQIGTGPIPIARIQRVAPSSFTVDIAQVEILELPAGGGVDTINTEGLLGVEQFLDGGTPGDTGFFPSDTLNVAGAPDPSVSPITLSGFGAIHHVNFEFSPEPEPGSTTFTAGLDGDQEVPPVATLATGRGTVVLNEDLTEITVSVEFSGLSSINTMTHIHGPASIGEEAGILFDLGNSGATDGVLGPNVFQVTPEEVADLMAGLWYFNVHTANNGGGEIRGQIFADRVIEAFLDPDQVTGSTVFSFASGFATVTLASTNDRMYVTLDYAGLTGEGVPGVNIATAIHGPAVRGSDADPIVEFPLRVSGSDADAFVTREYELTPEQAEGLRSGLWYIQVSSQEFPDGEIRGQIDDAFFCDSFEDNVSC